MATKLNPDVIQEGSITADKLDIESLKTDSGFVTGDSLSDKQDKLVSGTNIKTINRESILGSGDITIDYATKTYVDGLVGDINSVLESIISGGGSSEITFYIEVGADAIPMKALSNMTWEEFVNSEYANQNSMFTNFRLYDMASYNGIQFYCEEAMCDLTLYRDSNRNQNARHTDIIEDGKTYSAY